MSISRAFRSLRSSSGRRGKTYRQKMLPDCDRTVDGTPVHVWDSQITGKKLNVISSAISPLTDNFTRDYAVGEVRYEEYGGYEYEESDNGLKIGCYYEYNSMDGIEASNGDADKFNKIEARARSIRKYVHG